MSDPKRIKISEESHPSAEIIERELLKVLRREQPQSQNVSCVFVARDETDTIVGGLAGSTSYGWLLIKTLWIADRHQGAGLGRTLVQRAEERGRELGCHAAWLDTSSPGARMFYEKMGFCTFGSLGNRPGQCLETHRRWFLQKQL
ncbi:MAG: GNAT family N-acetyltransferase [Stappiaceae bacterium]